MNNKTDKINVYEPEYDKDFVERINETNKTELITNFNLDVNPRLNRSFVQVAHVGNRAIHFAVSYSKKNIQVEFQINSETLGPENYINVEIYKTLQPSKFCKIFFDMEHNKEFKNGIEYKYFDKINDVKSSYSNYLIKFLTQNIIEGSKDKEENCLIVNGWKVQDSNNELLFYTAQRKYFNDATGILTSKTYGIQFATLSGLEVLDKYYKTYEHTRF